MLDPCFMMKGYKAGFFYIFFDSYVNLETM